MFNLIMESEMKTVRRIARMSLPGQFEVTLTHMTYADTYVVRYGAHAKSFLTLPAALIEFNECAAHATACAGLKDE